MNVRDVLRVQLISKHTQGNGGKLQKPLFPKVFIPSSSPPTGIMWFCFFFFSLLIPDFQGSPTLSNNFLESHLRKVWALLPSPSNISTPELHSPPSLTALMKKGHCLQTQALPNLSRLNGSCLPKTAGQLFLEYAKNTIYGQSKQKSRAGKSECNTYSIVR